MPRAATRSRPRSEHRLAPEAASIGRARRLALHAAEGLLGPSERGDLELLISEVVTNAVRHGGGAELVLAVEADEARVRVEVTDDGAGLVPVPRAMTAEAEGGFGLFIVERLTRRWGMTRERGRTSVWFELALA